MTTKNRETQAPTVMAGTPDYEAMTAHVAAYRKNLKDAGYDDEVVERKTEREVRRLASKDPHTKRFQRVSVPNDSGGYDSRWRCRSCSEDVKGPDPSGHRCEEKTSKQKNVETSKRQNVETSKP